MTARSRQRIKDGVVESLPRPVHSSGALQTGARVDSIGEEDSGKATVCVRVSTQQRASVACVREGSFTQVATAAIPAELVGVPAESAGAERDVRDRREELGSRRVDAEACK